MGQKPNLRFVLNYQVTEKGISIMGFKVFVAILALYPTAGWSDGNPHQALVNGNVKRSMEKITDVNLNILNQHEYQHSQKTMSLSLERETRDLGIKQHKRYSSWLLNILLIFFPYLCSMHAFNVQFF